MSEILGGITVVSGLFAMVAGSAWLEQRKLENLRRKRRMQEIRENHEYHIKWQAVMEERERAKVQAKLSLKAWKPLEV
ncbi:hypothetical protein K6V78_02075 [Streptococcus gallolyticus]|uniref:hypothetical protein n=1 Tax=Streptococcus hepaticus TaxID=3349163 RepID=UPI001C952956|nr:hypothetical protein [Streptococcus gallolyticus]MBY5040426.1 hypothetical protein [Streptococcus gallolyticus]